MISGPDECWDRVYFEVGMNATRLARSLPRPLPNAGQQSHDTLLTTGRGRFKNMGKRNSGIRNGFLNKYYYKTLMGENKSQTPNAQ